MKKIVLEPIGVARNKVKAERFGDFAKEISEIILNKDYAAGLEGIEEYSHLIIVCWLDKVVGCDIRHRPQGNPKVPVVGIFACRCPQRPNPIGITTVKFVSRKRNILKVKGLDVLNGTPILDIKPYWPQYDAAPAGKIPSWVNKLQF